MQSTGQLDLQVPQAIQVSRIFLGMVSPPNNIYLSNTHILHDDGVFVNKKSIKNKDMTDIRIFEY
jgi:hypothetical protein